MNDQKQPADDMAAQHESSGRPLADNLKSEATWTRLLFMVICYVLVSLASFVGSFVVILGFLWLLFTGEVNRQIQQVGQSLATYIYQIVRYLTFNTDDRPFPLGGDWPPGTTNAN
jgi:Flp pilus assembly protein TadB